MSELPVIDVAALLQDNSLEDSAEAMATARAIRDACAENGFFYASGHGVDDELQLELEQCCREFFALPSTEKMQIGMANAGVAWRGFFPVGDELTSGQPDQKEGLYFGAEHPPDHPRVRAGTPLFGCNLFPDRPARLRPVVLRYLDAMTSLGHALMTGVALSLDLDGDHFRHRLGADPTVLFRVFHYPALSSADAARLWSVGEHTDYGLLTILRQDDAGGLEVKTRSGWQPAPPIPGTLVCNVGDMLDRMTGGRYLSVPHRVLNRSGRSRLSFPFFFDPSFDAVVERVPGCEEVRDNADERWDQSSVHAFGGTYGEYLLAKVGRVFPELHQAASQAPRRPAVALPTTE